MNKHLIFLSVSLLLLSISGCKSKTDRSTQTKPSDSVSTSGNMVDYVALNAKAAQFVPEIGKSGGQIILSTVSDPKSFNPITSTETSTTEFTTYMYEGLTKANSVTLMPQPNLADSWVISPDGHTYTFHIRDGVQWSDGVRFSAYDVEFTFNKLIYNDDINPNSSRDVFTIDGNRKIAVKAIDSSHVEFKLPSTFAPFLRFLVQEILPKHKWESIVKSKKFSSALSIATKPSDIVGTGPYLLESYTPSQKIVLKKNPLYWKKDASGNSLPYIDKVIYTIVTDQNAQLLQFKSREIDYLAAKGEDYPGLKSDEANGGYTVYRVGPAAGSNFLIFNQHSTLDPVATKKAGKSVRYVTDPKYTWFTNKKFRQAIAHIIDKDNMIKIVMNGLGYPQWSPMAPSEGYFFNNTTTRYPYDIAKAKSILADEGFKDSNGDGILEDKDGNILEFSLVTNSGNNPRIKIAEIIRKDMERLGIKVHFQTLEFNTIIQNMSNPPYNWDCILIGLTGGPEPHSGNNVWRSSGSLHMWNSKQKKPETSWEATIDSIYDAGVKELDTTKRKILYDRWQQIASDELPNIYTVLPEQIYCLSNKFGNINPCNNTGILHNLEYIYFKQ
ncbi:MAG: ABC transporter substrate-binding protein [Fibrobacter sp.]|nr:ABC transporter substrate-binding protein [Fibrobacter sp.]